MPSTGHDNKVIGANLYFDLKTSFETYKIEMLIDSKSRLIEFSIRGELSEFRDLAISALNKFIKVDLTRELNNGLMSTLSKNTFYQSYWYFICEKISFFLNPLAKEFTCSLDRICRCFNVSREEIEKVYSEGAKDILTVTNLTKAGGGCASCVSDIKKIIGSEALDQENVDSPLSTAIEGFSITNFPRTKIMNLWPAQFLIKEIIPLVEQIEGAEVIQFIEEHLYIKSSEDNLELEKFIKENKLEISIFYV